MQELYFDNWLFGKHKICIPESLIDNPTVFTEVISHETWVAALTDSQRSHLLQLIPDFPSAVDEFEKQQTVRLLLAGKVFKFGSPVKQFYKKLQDGAFVPDIASYVALCFKAKEREYRYQQKAYYNGLLREVLINRHRIVEAMHMLPPEEIVNFERITWNFKSVLQYSSVEDRVNCRYRQLGDVSEDYDNNGVEYSTDEPTKDYCHPMASDQCMLFIARGQEIMKLKRSHHRMMLSDVNKDSYRFMLCKHKKCRVESKPTMETIRKGREATHERYQTEYLKEQTAEKLSVVENEID